MSGAFEYAWALLKSVDFSDIAPMPTRYMIHPDSVRYGETKPKELTSPYKEIYEQHPKIEQEYMEGTYIPDLQSMLEREAMIQAMGNLSDSDYEDKDNPVRFWDAADFATFQMMRNRDWDMDNLPEYITGWYGL